MNRDGVILRSSVWPKTQELPDSNFNVTSWESSSCWLCRLSECGRPRPRHLLLLRWHVLTVEFPSFSFLGTLQRNGWVFHSLGTFCQMLDRSLLMKLCFRPQFPHSFDDALSPYDTFLLPLKGACGFPRCVMAFTGGPVASPTIFIWANMLSEARKISSVFASVKCDSRRSRSLTLLLRMPKINRSRRSSSGVVVLKSQASAISRNAVRYWS